MPNYEMINGKRSTHFYTIVRASLRRGSVKKSGGQESQALRRSRGWVQHQDPRLRRCAGLPAVFSQDLKNWISAIPASSALPVL
jgi:hypothetical protein